MKWLVWGSLRNLKRKVHHLLLKYTTHRTVQTRNTISPLRLMSHAVPTATLSTKTIPGGNGGIVNTAHMDSSTNDHVCAKNCAAYGPQGLVAYCLPNGGGDVLVACTNSSQIVQTLSGHSHPVTCIVWHPPHVSAYHQHANHLYTADRRGYVVLWDVAEGVMERTLCLPGHRSVRCMSLSSNRQLLIVLAKDNTSYIFDALLSDPNPIPNATIPLDPNNRRNHLPFSPSAFVFAPLVDRSTAAVLLGDRVRLISNVDALIVGGGSTASVNHLDPHDVHGGSGLGVPSPKDSVGSWAKDVIFDSEDGQETVIDICFSRAIPELLFLAARHWVSLYDWRLQFMLKEQIVWSTKKDVEFVSIYPVTPQSIEEDGRLLPHLFGLTSDGRMTAWYITSMDTFQTASCDTRGVRIPSKHVHCVCQSEMRSTDFCVLFTDGSVALWRFLTDERCWSLTGYIEVPIQRPVAVCGISFTEHHSASSFVGGAAAPLSLSAPDVGPASGGLHSPTTSPMTQSLPLNESPTPSTSQAPVRISGLEYGDRSIRQRLIVAALDSGDLVVQNAMFNVAQRKFTIVHAGTTKILQLAPHLDDLLWVATCRTAGPNRHYLQVALLSARSGELQRVLRDPSPLPEPSMLSTMTLDDTRTFMLLGFVNGSFEVWNVETRNLLFVNNGNSIHHVSWGPPAAKLDKNYGTFQLVVAMMEEGGGAQFFRVEWDRATRLKELLPIRVGGGGGSTIAYSCVVGGDLVCADSSVGASVVKGVGEATKWAALQQVPQRVAPINIVSSLTPSSGSGSSRSMRSSTATAASPLALIGFEDGTFGVWDTVSCKRLGMSKTHRTAEGRQSLGWLDGAVIALTPSGSIYLMDTDCETVNSSFMTRSLRRPMQSIAFMKPNHAMYLRSKWEMCAVRGRDELANRRSKDFPMWSLRLSQASVMSLTNTTTYLVQNIAQPLPCRGPLGQVITPTIMTLVEELELYADTMLPDRIASLLHVSAERCAMEAAACLVAQFCGQKEKLHFWALVRYWRHSWEKNADAILEFSKGDVDAGSEACLDEGGSVDALDSAFLQQWSHDILCPSQTAAPFGPMSPLFAADKYSEALAPVDILEMNRKCLIALRRYALNSLRGHNVDDSEARLVMSRELLSLGDHAAACELLIDANIEHPSFDRFATLAIAIAGAAQQQQGPAAQMLELTSKRAAAMLLAKGDVDGAAEKFSMIGEHYEASLALQSRGLWNGAALVARLSPMTESCRGELLHRYATHCAQRGEGLVAARMLLGLRAPRQALVILADCAPLTDVAGLFAVALARQYAMLSESCLSTIVASPLRTSHGATSSHQAASPSETFGQLLISLLGDYENHLKAVGNVFCQQLVASLIAGLRSPESSFHDSGAAITE
jgi:WD40 repeat protein